MSPAQTAPPASTKPNDLGQILFAPQQWPYLT